MLNPSPEQQLVGDAVVAGQANNLTIALPGSGKSTTCIAAVVRLINSHPGAKPHMISFSAAAAAGINSKLKAILPANLFHRVTVSTFHAVLLEMYKSLPNAKELVLGPRQIGIISRAIERSRLVMELEEAQNIIENETRVLNPPKQSKIVAAYKEVLDRYHLIDFNLICRTVVKAMEEGKIKPLNVTHMIVDEFQDTDEVQLRWLYYHHLAGVRITAVGDDDQSIYGFRGALGFEIMERYIQDFDAQTFYLSNCFRCGRKILAAAEFIINFNQRRLPKVMNAISKNEGKLKVIPAHDRKSSIAAVADRIEAEPGEWAVLGRNGAHLDGIELELNMKKIRCKRIGGKSIWDTPAANCTLYLLQLILEQKITRDAHLAFAQLLKMPENIINEMESHRSAHLAEIVLETNVSSAQKSALLTLVALASDSRDDADIRKRLERLANAVISMGHGKADIGIMVAILRMIARDNGSWLERLERITSRLRSVSKKGEIELDSTIVALTTLHGSKGLEWDNVAIIELCHGIYPGSKIDTDEGFEEERRLMFVGMTRAKKVLDLHFHGQPNIYITELSVGGIVTWGSEGKKLAN